jgi:hypothetical protein
VLRGNFRATKCKILTIFHHFTLKISSKLTGNFFGAVRCVHFDAAYSLWLRDVKMMRMLKHEKLCGSMLNAQLSSQSQLSVLNTLFP